MNYIIGKDVLGQIIYELLKNVEIDSRDRPIIISLDENAIN